MPCHSASHLSPSWGVLLQITIIKGKVEEVELPVQKVDVIISEVRSPSHQRLPLATGLCPVWFLAAVYKGGTPSSWCYLLVAFVQLPL